jgi:hypothetical protein
MKTPPTRIFRALGLAAALAAVPCHAAAQAPPAPDEPAGAQMPPAAPAQDPQQGVAAGETGAAPAEPAGQEAVRATPDADDAAPDSGTDPAEGDAPVAPEPEPAPVTAAFGITLGEPFSPCIVAEVLGEESVTYRDADKAEQTGTRYRVVPKVPNSRFTDYAVDVNRDGIVYAVRASFESEVGENLCGITKELAASLEEKYGQPRGRGSFGEWYAFRDTSVEHYRGIRLYSNRCRRGIYEIIYSDDAAKLAPAPAPAEASANSGL